MQHCFRQLLILKNKFRFDLIMHFNAAAVRDTLSSCNCKFFFCRFPTGVSISRSMIFFFTCKRPHVTPSLCRSKKFHYLFLRFSRFSVCRCLCSVFLYDLGTIPVTAYLIISNQQTGRLSAWYVQGNISSRPT